MNMLFRRSVVAFLAAMLLSFASLGWAGSVLDRVTKTNVIKVGMSGDQAPMNAKARDGSTIGLEVDFATALALAMGLDLEIVNIPFGDLEEALRKGKVDMVMSGMAITPERAKKMAFVGPYMLSGKSLVTKIGSLAAADETADIDSAEIKIAVLANSTSQSFVEKYAPKAKVVKVANYDEGVKMLIGDEVSAMVADMPACVLAVLRNPDAGLVTTTTPLKLEPIGIAVDARDEEFRNLVQNYVVGLERTGIVDALRKKWFESAEWVRLLP